MFVWAYISVCVCVFPQIPNIYIEIVYYSSIPNAGTKSNAGPDRGHGGVLGHGGGFGAYKVGGYGGGVGAVGGGYGGGGVGGQLIGPLGIPSHGFMVAVVFDRRRITSCSCTCGSQVGTSGLSNFSRTYIFYHLNLIL